MYTAALEGVSVAAVPQNLWEVRATGSIIIHSIRFAFLQQTVLLSAVPNMQLSWARLASFGSGGVAVTPNPIDDRNTIPATTTFNSLVTSPGPILYNGASPAVLGAYVQKWTASPFDLIAHPIQMSGGYLGISLLSAPPFVIPLSGEIVFEEL